MKRFCRIACIVCAVMLVLSCTKSVPQICRGVDFKESHLYVNAGDGMSRFVTWTGDEFFSSDYVLDVIFENINELNPGQKTTAVSACFQDPRVNGYAAFTSEYTGSISLVKRSEKKADIVFSKVVMNIRNTDYLFDGIIPCSIENPTSH